MADGRGGARTGAGRKPKPLQEKILEGKTKGVRVLKVDSSLKGEDMPRPSEFLKEQTKGASENLAESVYINLWNWLKERKAEKFINPQLLEQYSLSVARWKQAESAVNQFGFLAKHPTTGMPIASPYIKIAQDFLKQCNNMWAKIDSIIRENCSEYYEETEDDIMSRILNSSLD